MYARLFSQRLSAKKQQMKQDTRKDGVGGGHRICLNDSVLSALLLTITGDIKGKKGAEIENKNKSMAYGLSGGLFYVLFFWKVHVFYWFVVISNEKLLWPESHCHLSFFTEEHKRKSNMRPSRKTTRLLH